MITLNSNAKNTTSKASTDFDKFRELTKKLLSVSKKDIQEIEKRQQAEKEQQRLVKA